MEIKLKSRNKVTRKRKPVILIATEGKNMTEKLYFNNFNRNKNYSIVFAKGNYTDPVNMVNSLIKDLKDRELNKKNGDIAYCVFDTDFDVHKQKEILIAKKKTKNLNIELIKSNPCFEIWFILHFSNSTKQYKSNEEVIKELKKYIPKYKKNTDVFAYLDNKRKNAIKNAKLLEKYHIELGRNIDYIECNPSSEVYKVFEQVNKI